ncbi:MAG: single-stranded-DNA-specific exonuclease RecJ [Cardiobacteriaceae bacterium]|nr:single-stranded-DNA-specific exonuclease RecJ [Cardiobacteriaceae bacterium]
MESAKLHLRPYLCNPLDFPEDCPDLVRTLYARRLQQPTEWDKSLKHLLPAELKDIDKAVARLIKALKEREPILVYGDYDVDGACATALMVRVLKRLGMQVSWFIPDRLRHGYGLSVAGVAAARVYHPQIRLWLTVDNGMNSHAMAEALANQGIELIITDHHLPLEHEESALPTAIAVVNPNRLDCGFASKALCGTGVAFYVLMALQQALKHDVEGKALWSLDLKLTEYLDLVALATIADVMTLDYNNRILVEHGLRLLRRGQGNMGLKSLLAQANVDYRFVSAQDLAFMVAPRLNAAGRIAHMKEGLQLLLSDERVGAQDLAYRLDEYNRERKALENDLWLQVKAQANPQSALSYAYLNGGHEGLLGILAGKLKALWGKPSLVLCASQEEDWVKGSLRSCYGVALDKVLAEASLALKPEDLRFGGHAMAAGLSVHQSALPRLLSEMETILSRDFPDHYPEEPEWSDGYLSPEYFTVAWANYLELLEPWGSGLPAPVFYQVFEVLDERVLGQHSRLLLRHPENGEKFQAMWFFANQRLMVGNFVGVHYRLSVNRFHGDERLVLHIQSVQSAL